MRFPWKDRAVAAAREAVQAEQLHQLVVENQIRVHTAVSRLVEVPGTDGWPFRESATA